MLCDAIDKGYTEPDARDDLSGTDVARKLIILAPRDRAQLELEDVAVESLVPASLRDCTVAEFRARATELDAPMQARLSAARRTIACCAMSGQLDVATGRRRSRSPKWSARIRSPTST